MIWNDAQITRLSALLAEGLTARQAAEALGGGLTKNAVIGKALRAGIPINHRTPTAAPEVLAERRRQRDRARRRAAAPAYPVPSHRSTPDQRAAVRAEYGQRVAAAKPLAAPNSVPVTLLMIENGQCRFVLDEHTRGSKTLMCGAPVDNGSWCRFHHATVFHPRAE